MLSTFILIIFLSILIFLYFNNILIRRRILQFPLYFIIVSVVIYFVVQLPESNYVDLTIAAVKGSGDVAQLADLENVRTSFYLDKSWYVQYFHWIGLYWFFDFENIHRGVLLGNLGLSMVDNSDVLIYILDRLPLTILVGLSGLLLTWSIGVPLGVISALKNNKFIERVITILSYLALSTPSFFIALLMLLLFYKFRETVVDLNYISSANSSVLTEITLLILAVTASTLPSIAECINITKSNFVDEMAKPYIRAVRSRGVRPLMLILKYPLRLTLIPIASSLGFVLPVLISSGGIVAIVIGIPTLGPALFKSLISQDTYYSASLLLIMSSFGYVGSLVGDILLCIIDPRIEVD